MSTILLFVFTAALENSFFVFTSIASFSVLLYLLTALITASMLFSFNSSSLIIYLARALKLNMFLNRHFLIMKSFSRKLFTCSDICVIKGINRSLFINLMILCHNIYIVTQECMMNGKYTKKCGCWDNSPNSGDTAVC